jgi:hypothetical protein
MKAQLELSWIGGATERRLRRRRPGSERLPWGTTDLATFDDAELAEARSVWTNAVFTEYASAAAFSAFASGCLEACAPIDLTATISDCAVDELAHVELASRFLAELGGAAPFVVDMEAVSPRTTPGARATLRAAEVAITTSCVGEALSLPALRHGKASAKHPLAKAVIARLLADEGQHARVVFTYLAWAEDRLTAGERSELASLALSAIESYSSLWRGPSCGCPETALTAVIDDDYKRGMRRAVRDNIARPLAKVGIELDPTRLEHLLAS